MGAPPASTARPIGRPTLGTRQVIKNAYSMLPALIKGVAIAAVPISTSFAGFTPRKVSVQTIVRRRAAVSAFCSTTSGAFATRFDHLQLAKLQWKSGTGGDILPCFQSLSHL